MSRAPAEPWSSFYRSLGVPPEPWPVPYAAQVAAFQARYPGVDLRGWQGIFDRRGFDCDRCYGQDPGMPGGHCGSGDCLFAVKAELWTRQGGRCPYCGEGLRPDLWRLHVDHVIPRVWGGPWADWNLRLAHGACNSRKGGRVTLEAVALAEEHGVPLTYRGRVRT